MSPRVLALIASGVLNIAALVGAWWLLDQLDAERRRVDAWRRECEFWRQRADRGVWHTCGCRKTERVDA